MSTQDEALKRLWYKEIFENAYAMMNEPIIDGNCGALCGYHCCRRIDLTGERLGMYLLPLEYEYMQIHACPLLGRISEWRQAFIDGVYAGWLELMKIPIIKYNTLYFSMERTEMDNILKQYTQNGWIK